METKKKEDLLEVKILEYIASEPQTLKSLIDLTKSTSATVSWICQNLRGKGIIILNNEGYFCLPEPVSPVPNIFQHLQKIVTKQSFENPQQLI